MSYNPLVLSVLEDLARPTRTIFDQDFGLGLLDEDLIVPRRQCPIMLSNYYRPYQIQQRGQSNVSTTANEFKVSLDVQQFKPEEISVKVADGSVIIEGKHEERADEHGFISRQFVRRYKLPETVDDKNVTSSLSSDGVLVVSAPKAIKVGDKERVVPITKTNAPAIKGSKGDGKKEVKQPETMEH